MPARPENLDEFISLGSPLATFAPALSLFVVDHEDNSAVVLRNLHCRCATNAARGGSAVPVGTPQRAIYSPNPIFQFRVKGPFGFYLLLAVNRNQYCLADFYCCPSVRNESSVWLVPLSHRDWYEKEYITKKELSFHFCFLQTTQIR